MKKNIIFILFFMWAWMPSQAAGSVVINNPSAFQASNPDIGKYLFTKLFITGLEYFQLNAERIEKKVAFTEKTLRNSQRVRALIDSLIIDNVNLRIARNYMKRFRNHPENALMREVSKLFLEVCDEQIELNNLERILLDKLVEIQSLEFINSFDMDNFNDAHNALYARKKESLKKLLESAVLVTKVLVSNKIDEDGMFSNLGITKEEREKLLFQLDEFYGRGYEGSLRPGQTFLESSVVTLKERLLDNSFGTIK